MDNQQRLAGGAAHLSKHDAVLAPIIARYGECTILPHSNYYQELVESIIGQQLSVTAAATICRCFTELFPAFPAPEQILQKSADDLRGAGLSQAKANYVRDLAQHIVDGRLEVERLPELDNQQVIAELTAVKGIGEWTAHMFLIFSLGRLDVLPTGDLGLRRGMQLLYRLPDLPSPDAMREIAARNHWSPYESVASWYVWRSLENKPGAS